MSDASSVSDGTRSDGSSSPVVTVRGGSGGVASIIRMASQQQGGGLRALGKVNRETRALKTRSTVVQGSAGFTGANPGKRGRVYMATSRPLFSLKSPLGF